MQSQQIQVKADYDGEIRRFTLQPNPLYFDLTNQIHDIFGVNPRDKLVVKYLDEEGDYVTISSNEELHMAVQSVTGAILKLNLTSTVVQEKALHQKISTPSPIQEDKVHQEHLGNTLKGEWKPKFEARLQKDSQMRSQFTEKLQKKIEKLKETKESLINENSSNSNHSLQQRIQRENMKIEKLESKLAYLINLPGAQTSVIVPSHTQQTDQIDLKIPKEIEIEKSQKSVPEQKDTDVKREWKPKFEERLQKNPQLRSQFTEKLQKKIEKLKETKESLINENSSNSNPSLQQRIQRENMKIEKLEAKLSYLNNLPNIPSESSEDVVPLENTCDEKKQKFREISQKVRNREITKQEASKLRRALKQE